MMGGKRTLHYCMCSLRWEMKMGGVAVTLKTTGWQHGVLWVGIRWCSGIILDVQCPVTLTTLRAALDAVLEHCFVPAERGRPRPKAKQLPVPCAPAGLAWPRSDLVVSVQGGAAASNENMGLSRAGCLPAIIFNAWDRAGDLFRALHGTVLDACKGTRKCYVPWKHAVYTLLFCLSWGGVWGILSGIAACLRLCFFSRYSSAELSFLVHFVYWSKSSSFSMNLCFEREKSQRKRNWWEQGE